MNTSTKIAIVVAVVALLGVTTCPLRDATAPSAPDNAAAPAADGAPRANAAKPTSVETKAPRRRTQDDAPPAPTKSVAAGVSAKSASVAPKKPVAPPGGFPEGPPAEGEVVGKVLLLPARTPVEGAVVTLMGGHQSTEVAPFPDPSGAVTGANGVFRIGGFHPGGYSFQATAEGRTPRTFTAKVPDGGGVGDIEVLLGSGGAIEGRVTGASGPAVGVAVRLDRLNASTKTDAEGLYRFEDLPGGNYWVEVVEGAKGLGNRRATVDVPTGKTAHLDFPGGASLVGQLASDGTPLEGAIVRVQRIGEPYSAAQTRAAKDGTFRIDALAPGVGRVGVQVLGEPGFSVDLDEVTIAPGENRLDPRLGQGDASSSIAGRVFAKSTGSPLSAQDVQISLQALVEKAEGVWAIGPVVSGMAFADAKGEFRIPWLRAGRYRLTVYPNGRQGLARTYVDLVLGAAERRTGVEVALPDKPPREEEPSASVLSGVVKDAEGRPISHASLRATSDAASDRIRAGFTDETGRYTIERLEPGRWRVQVQVYGADAVATDVAEVAIAAGANALDVALGTGDLVGEVGGRVVAKSSGKPLSSKQVQLALNDVGPDGKVRATAWAWADADGKFRFRYLRSGRFRLVASPTAGSLRMFEKDVDVAAGQQVEGLDVALDDLATGKVVFVVKDEQGKAVDRVEIEATRDGKREQGSIGANSSVGVYETHLEVGAHAVTIRGATGALVGAADVDVREGETTKVEVVLHAKQ